MDKGQKMTTRMEGIIRNENFVIFGEDFARHPHALEHILRPLFFDNRFLWVETIGLRSPRLNWYDLKRIFEKVSKWIGSEDKKSKKTEIPDNVFVIAPLMIPFNQFGFVRKFNRWSVLRNCKRELSKRGMSNPISIASVPNAGDYIGAFNERLKIYFCVDEFSLWPGLDSALVKKLEDNLISNVDMILATSDYLANTKKKPELMTKTITHGVEFDHFNIGPNKKVNQNIKLCYFGLFDERSDQTMLNEIARQVLDCEIHIFGKVVCDVSALRNVSNIKFHGSVNYQDLPVAISEMDIFLLPYVRNTLTDNINPLKLKEYLSTGRPVISTDLPEVVKFKNFLFIGKNAQDFISIINNLKSSKSLFYSKKVASYMEANETWNAKARLLSDIIHNTLSAY